MNIMSNEVVIEEDSKNENYDYEPDFMCEFLLHLRAGGAQFMMNILVQYFPDYSVYSSFPKEVYPKFVTLFNQVDRRNKQKFINHVIKYLDGVFCDLLLKPENQEIREKILLQTVTRHEERFNDFMDCSKFIRTILYHRRLVKCDNQVWLKQKDGRWINNESEIKSNIVSLILNNDFRILKKGGEDPVYNKIERMTPAKEISDMVLMDLKDERRLLSYLWSSTKGKLTFLNGTYDFKDNTFYEGDGTIHMINRNLNDKSNPKVREELMTRIFRPIFTMDHDKQGEEKFKYFMYCVSRMFAGDIEDKRILLLTGARDCGKGMLGTLIENCIDEYSFPMDLGAFKVGRASSDQAKENSWLIPLQFRRVTIMNENSDVKLDGNKMKQFGSGGDSIMARSNHKDEIQIKIQASGIIMANDTPNLNVPDVYEKIEQISLVSKFVNESFPESKKLHGIKYYPSDNTLKSNFLQRNDVLNEFMLMLIEAYQTKMKTPDFVLKERDDDDDEYQKLREGFQYSENGKVTNKELMEHIRKLGIMKKQNDIKKMLRNVFGDSIDIAYRTSSMRGIKGLQIVQQMC